MQTTSSYKVDAFQLRMIFENQPINEICLNHLIPLQKEEKSAKYLALEKFVVKTLHIDKSFK